MSRLSDLVFPDAPAAKAIGKRGSKLGPLPDVITQVVKLKEA